MAFPTAYEVHTPVKRADETAIRCSNVSVYFSRPVERIPTLKEHLLRRLVGLHTEHQEFWALRDINFEVKRGEAFGIVGRNGAGKSTLLKVIARVMYPKKGSVYVKGRVLPLLQLGAGFDSELTGRENIFLYGSVLNLSRDFMRQRLDEIIDFAELAPFIDSPLRTYSSGMKLRLAFAIAATVEPEVLIVDEVLAVGDMSFQQKSQARIAQIRQSGCTILFVSHSLSTVQEICTRAIWLDHGQIQAIGPASEVIHKYVSTV